MTELPNPPEHHWWRIGDVDGQLVIALETAYPPDYAATTIIERAVPWEQTPLDNGAKAARVATELLREIDPVTYQLSRLEGAFVLNGGLNGDRAWNR